MATESLVENINELWLTYKPEIVGILAGISIPLICGVFSIEIKAEQVETISSLLVQVLSAYLGLLLATFGVLYGLNLKKEYIAKAEANKLTEAEKENIKISLKEIYNDFVLSIKTLALGGLITFCFHVVALVGKQNKILHIEQAFFVNSLCVGVMFSFITMGTLNIIATVRTILALTDLD